MEGIRQVTESPEPPGTLYIVHSVIASQKEQTSTTRWSARGCHTHEGKSELFPACPQQSESSDLQTSNVIYQSLADQGMPMEQPRA